MFTQPAFIRKSSFGLRKKLEELGYEPSTVDDHKGLFLCTSENGLYYSSNNHLSQKYGEYISPYGIFCEDNEALFLAIAALRDDSDANQWFTNGADRWCRFGGDKHISKTIDSMCINLHKATVEELIEHFKTE